MPDLDVRPVRPDEYARVGQLTLDAYDALGHAVGEDYRIILADVGARVELGVHVLVAELDGEVVGSVAATTNHEDFFEYQLPEHGDSGFRMLAVDPAAQGSGAGAALVDACLDLACAAGCTRTTITSMVWMERAHAMYARRGFDRIPELDRYFGSGLGLCFSKALVADAPIVRAWTRPPGAGRPRAEVDAERAAASGGVTADG